MIIVRVFTIAAALYLMYISYRQYKKGNSITPEENKSYRGKAIVCDISIIAGLIVQIIGSLVTA